MNAEAFRYAACGLQIDSEIAISHLPAGDKAQPADLRIRACREIAPFEARVSTPQWQLGDEGVLLFGLSGEQCLCTAGAEISFAGIAPPLDETFALLGRALAVICYQRGLPVFHAAILERDGKAVALAGRSGAGKSTLAMELFGRGFRVVADDIAACEITAGGLVARPLYPVTRRRATGQASEQWRPVPGTGKQVSTSVPFCPEARRIERMFVIEIGGVGSPQVRDVPTLEAAPLLETQCYRKGLGRALLGYQGLRRRIAEAAAHLPISVVVRPANCRPAALAKALLERLERP